jgi:NADH dehydrogenase FAD-containing subunit
VIDTITTTTTMKMHPFESDFAKALLLLLHCTAVVTTDAFCARSNQMLLPTQTSFTQMKLYVDNSEGEEQPHSVWYNRYKEYQYQSDTLDDYDFVLNDRELIESDPALNLLSSEIGVKEYFTKQIDLSHQENIPFSVLAERAFDTIEDIFQHLQRIPYENGSAKITPEEELTRKTVVVLGSGWGAHALMKVANCNKLRIIVVSPSNHFVFTPMLASAATGTVEYRSMTEAVRSANGMIEEYIEGKAVGVDIGKKRVTVRLNSLLDQYGETEPPEIELEYDHLVVAVGCKVDVKGVPGATNSLRLKSCDDARKLRTAIGECFEYASRPDVSGADREEERTRRSTFLIVGGGPTGVELAGELYDLAEDITRPHKGSYPRLRNNVKVVLCHSGSALVPQFEQPLQEEALKSLRRKGVKVILNTRVTELKDGYAKLSTKKFDKETGEKGRVESELPIGLSVWCAGTAPVSFVSQLLDQLPDAARNADGRIKVDKWLRPQMDDPSLLGSVLVLGDAAACMEDDDFLPQTAQVAGQQGAYLARLLSRGYDLETTPLALPCTPLSPCDIFYDPMLTEWLKLRGLDVASKFSFLNLGLLAYLGGGEALSQVQVGEFPLFAYSGSVAFVLWRSVYLVKQVATKNRILVTFDWIKNSVFGRDMTRF